jgi:hypothetical protein
MTTATADRTSSFRIASDASGQHPAKNVEVMERYMRWFLGARALSNVRAEPRLYALAVPLPAWLKKVQERIQNSVIPSAVTENDGHWLSQQTAEEASDFFNKTADLLPEEPFIYGTKSGDLIAEFNGPLGNLTSIVSPTCIVLFAAVGDQPPVETKITDPSQVRDGVEKMAKLLSTGRHGKVEPFR